MNLSGTVRVNPVGLVVMVLLLLMVIYFNFASDQSGSMGKLSITRNTISLKSLLAASIYLAEQGGAQVKRVRTQGDGSGDLGEKSKGKTKEGANDPVTQGDLLSHQAMYYGFLKTFPALSIVSEEHESTSEPPDVSKWPMAPLELPQVDDAVPDDEDVILPASDVLIWIDPLDATQEYTEKLLDFVTTMVCVAVNGKPTIGIIHKPFSAETFWAWAGPNRVSGNLQEYKMAKSPTDGKTHLIVSRSHSGTVKDTATKAFGPQSVITPAGGAGYKVLEVVKGQHHAYLHLTNIKKWDLCAGNAILRALGGNMTDLQGHPILFFSNQFHVSGGVLATMSHHAEYLDKLSRVSST